MQDLNVDTVRTDIPTSSTVTDVLIWDVEQSGENVFSVTYEVDQQIKEGDQTRDVSEIYTATVHVDADTINDATAFLETFFKLYPTATDKELACYVEGNALEPINGDYLYSELVNPVFTADGDNVRVSVAVKFIDNQTKATQVSQYELTLHKDSFCFAYMLEYIKAFISIFIFYFNFTKIIYKNVSTYLGTHIYKYGGVYID